MKALRLALFELRRFRGRMRYAGLAFLVIVPTLYGALYLLAYWDPFGKLDQIPVAVVNKDEPVKAQGEKVDAGRQFVNRLKSEPVFEWHFTTAEEASDGLKAGRYYFIITVPRNFSRRLTSPARGSPKQAELHVRLDDANGFIAGIVAQTAQLQIQQEINAAAISAYTEAALARVVDARKQLQQATRGARKLTKGARKARNGAAELDQGIGELKRGADDLVSGSRQVRNGARQLQGAFNVAAGTLTRALERAAGPLRRFANGAEELASQTRRDAARIAGLTGRAHRNLRNLGQSRPRIGRLRAFQRVLKAARNADNRAQRLANGTGQIAQSLDRVAGESNRLAARKNELESQLQQGQQQVGKLADGAAEVADGAVKLRNGLVSTKQGSSQLKKGTSQLVKGNRKLANQLGDAVSELPSPDADERARQAKRIANPVKISETNAHPAGEYGRGLAPFFFSIALWVFGIVAYMMLRPTYGEALVSRLRAPTIAIGTWLPAAIIGTAGALVLYLVVDVGLGLDPVSVLGTIGLSILAVGTFTAIVLLLRMAFGAIGDALALLALIVQLVSCGGLYPVETTPGVLRAISPFAPMTYLVDGFRVTMTGGQGSHLLRDALILAAILVVALLLVIAVVHRQRTWTMNRLKPELEL